MSAHAKIDVCRSVLRTLPSLLAPIHETFAISPLPPPNTPAPRRSISSRLRSQRFGTCAKKNSIRRWFADVADPDSIAQQVPARATQSNRPVVRNHRDRLCFEILTKHRMWGSTSHPPLHLVPGQILPLAMAHDLRYLRWVGARLCAGSVPSPCPPLQPPRSQHGPV